MQLGVSLPVADIGTGPAELRDYAQAASDKLRRLTREAGRNLSAMGLEVWASPGAGTEDDWRREIAFWKQAGVTHVTAHTTYASNHHKRIAAAVPPSTWRRSPATGRRWLIRCRIG